MATVSIQVPGVGESITEGILASWLKPDAVYRDPLSEFDAAWSSQDPAALRSALDRLIPLTRSEPQ